MMLLCGPCEKIMRIRLNQRKSFYFDLCPHCRTRVREALHLAKVAKTG